MSIGGAARPWSADEEERLAMLWGRGLSARAIASSGLPGRSKSAIIGKAHRLGLPSRPSPIRRNS